MYYPLTAEGLGQVRQVGLDLFDYAVVPTHLVDDDVPDEVVSLVAILQKRSVEGLWQRILEPDDGLGQRRAVGTSRALGRPL